MWRSCLCGWCCSVCVLVVYVVCCCLHEVGSRAQATLYRSSWQSCTGDAVPRVVNMHGVRPKGDVHVQGGRGIPLVSIYPLPNQTQAEVVGFGQTRAGPLPPPPQYSDELSWAWGEGRH